MVDGSKAPTMSLDALPEGWVVWSDEATKVVLAYRPDVFDTEQHPAACLPTLYLTKGQRDRRPGRPQPGPEDSWYVTLYLEPEINTDTAAFETRAEAVSHANEIAADFDAGEIDYRSLYQVPREEYFDRLDELTGRDA